MRLGDACHPEWGYLAFSCFRSELLSDSAHLHNCCGDQRYDKRSNILLADLSPSGRNVRCGADFGACCRSDRGGGQDWRLRCHHNRSPNVV